MTKAFWVRKGAFSSHFHMTVHHWRKSEQELKLGRVLKAGTEAETMESCCLLTCSHGLLKLLSWRTKDYHPRDDPIHSGLGSPLSLVKKMPSRFTYSLTYWGILNWGSLSSDDSRLCQVGIKLASTMPKSGKEPNSTELKARPRYEIRSTGTATPNSRKEPGRRRSV